MSTKDSKTEQPCTIHGVNKSYSAMVWNDISKIKPINKGLYYCFIPESKRYHEHISEYWFDGNGFRDGDTLFKGKFGGSKITEYITHWLIIEKPCAG